MYDLDCKFAKNIIMFEEAMQFKEAIILCYNRYNIVKINGIVPLPIS